jgi:hypothetical protein
MDLNRMEPGQPLEARGDGCATARASVAPYGRVAHSGKSRIKITENGEHNENASLSGRELTEHSRSHDDFKFRSANANAVGQDGITAATPDRTARPDVRNREPLGNPAHCIAKGDTENTRHKIYVGVSSAHVADKATDAVSSFVETKGRIGVAVSVIFRSPAFCSPVPNLQSKRTANVEN